MTKRTFTTKSGTIFEWEETPETIKMVEELTKFAGNYEGPLYAPYTKVDNGKETN